MIRVMDFSNQLGMMYVASRSNQFYAKEKKLVAEVEDDDDSDLEDMIN